MKKKLIASIVIFCFVVTMGIGTVIAYFVSVSGPVVNTFTVGDIALELKDDTMDLIHLIPGTTVERSSVVTVVKESEDCYVYVKLECPRELSEYVSYEMEEGWINLGGIDGVYYRQVERASINQKYHVFQSDEISINNTLTKEKMSVLDDSGYVMKITAYAIQTMGMESPADGWYNLLTELEG